MFNVATCSSYKRIVKILKIIAAWLIIATMVMEAPLALYAFALQDSYGSVAEQEAQELRVAVLSEPRIFPQSMISDSPAFNEIVRSDIAMLSESRAILDAAISEIIAQAPDVLLITGNLTKDGEVASHEYLAERLNYLRAMLPNIKIYVINGSRDMSKR